MTQESANYEIAFKNLAHDCQYQSNNKEYHDMSTGQVTASGRVVTRQDSCASDVSLVDGPSTTFNENYGHLFSPYDCERRFFGSVVNKADSQKQIVINIQSNIKNIKSKLKDTEWETRFQCEGHVENKQNKQTFFFDRKLPIIPQIHRQQEVLLGDIKKDGTILVKDSARENEFEQRFASSSVFDKHTQSIDGAQEKTALFENQPQVFSQKTLKHSMEPEYCSKKSSEHSRAELYFSQNLKNWKLKSWTSYLIWIVLLFALAMSTIRLQARVDQLESTVLVLGQTIQKCGQLEGRETSTAEGVTLKTGKNIMKSSTSDSSFGFTESSSNKRKDPMNGFKEHDKTGSISPQAGERENQKLHYARKKFPAKAADKMVNPAALSDDVSTTPGSEISTPAKNLLTLQNLFGQVLMNRNLRNTLESNVTGDSDQWIDLKPVDEEKTVSKHRTRRDNTRVQAVNDYCVTHVCKNKKEKSR